MNDSRKHLAMQALSAQRGMTLIELSVVLLILIGLAGVLVPYVGSFNQTTHDSTNSNNMTQLNSAMGRYVVDKNRLPPHVDLLTNAAAGGAGATGTCAAAVANASYCGLANPALFTPTAYAANSVAANSLASSGINMAVLNDPNIANKTFGTSTGMLYLDDPTGAAPMGGTSAYGATTNFAIVNAGPLASVEAHLAKALGRDPMVYNSACYDYVAVGIGDNNELIQSTMAAAPVYFPQDAKYGPAETYAHYIAILQVDKANVTPVGAMMPCSGITEKAKFLGVVANVPTTESTSLVGVNTLLAQGWQNKVAN